MRTSTLPSHAYRAEVRYRYPDEKNGITYTTHIGPYATLAAVRGQVTVLRREYPHREVVSVRIWGARLWEEVEEG